MKRLLIACAVAWGAGAAFAKLPPPSPEAQAKAAEAKAKADHTAKVDAYKLCLSQDRVAAHYRAQMKATGKDAKPATSTAACVDPGPYQAPTPPIEQAGAHSPAATAAKPPSSPAPQAGTAKQ
ncbi:MAG TPA: hypothetical protein VNO84_17535 [Burkholderiaceae bacterium]|nr:hypothetical protein [Burkholderiaceae bacterium]